MPLLGKSSRDVLPPIKNPVFSLTERNAVTITEQTDSTKDEGKQPIEKNSKAQKNGRFSGFGNPFKRRPTSTGSTASAASSNTISGGDERIPSAQNKTESGRADAGPKHLSLDSAQSKLVVDNRRSPRQRVATPLENDKFKNAGGNSEVTHLQVGKQNVPSSSPATSPRPCSVNTIEDLGEIITNARANDNYSEIESFLTSTFETFAAINKRFQDQSTQENIDPYNTAINYDFMEYVYESIRHFPKDQQKLALRSIINCLLKDAKRPGNNDDLRALLILLMNPQFFDVSTYTIFAHLLRHICTLPDADQRTILYWFYKVPVEQFKRMIKSIHQFVAQRLFPTNVSEMPPVEKCRWWIQTAVKVLALLHSANWVIHPPVVDHAFFYCDELNRMDLMKEYDTWQRQTGRFSFCQYPFLLSLQSKRFVMQKDSEMKMLFEARESIVKHVKRREVPNMGMLFLNLKVRRSHLVSDSLDEIARKKKDLKKKLRVSFEGEPGLDLGGLTKEWFLLLIRKIFREEYGMFTYNAKTRIWWFNSASIDTEHEFNLLGVLMGLAVYNSINLDIRLPLCCYKKLLSPAVVPFQNPQAPVGIAQLGLHDLSDVNPELAHGLKELVSYEGDVENDLCQTFQISYKSFGDVVTKELKRNGAQIPVTKENRDEYVKLYVNYILNKSIYKQFYAFYHGFHSVCASNALILLRPEEVEMLVCGNPHFDIEALQKVTVYDGFSKNDAIIRRFWEVVCGFNIQLKKKLLLFTTGSDRIPVGGMNEMKFKITRMEGQNVDKMLPMAHTCFNQIILPSYKSRKTLKQKLTIAISNSEGFGIE
ncbi:probable E3 ubiquitin-protein ligase HECTD2 [Rhopilema esculentum]|uniref:probable E3 ubiquitin-protein ligase HECTD2 n=1 Tax=Rhopilema esculentum TaxID=499914 RepID=UPI0031DB6729